MREEIVGKGGIGHFYKQNLRRLGKGGWQFIGTEGLSGVRGAKEGYWRRRRDWGQTLGQIERIRRHGTFQGFVCEEGGREWAIP